MDQPESPASSFRVQIRVRYKDTDAAGVVYYGNYLTYFEVARVEALRALGMPIREVEARGVLLPAVAAHVEYKRPALVDDLLTVSLWLDRVGKSSFGFVYEVRRGDELIATGSTRHAAVERDTLRPMRLEGWLLELVEQTRRGARGAVTRPASDTAGAETGEPLTVAIAPAPVATEMPA